MERALAASRSDDCVVIAEEIHRQPALGGQHADHQRRGGPAADRHRTTAAVPGRARAGTGAVSRAGVRPDQVEAVVRAAEERPPRAPPPRTRRADRAGEPGTCGIDANRLGRQPAGPTSACCATSPPRWAGVARRRGGGRKLYGFAEHEVTTTYLGTSTGLRLRHVQPTGRLELTGKSADLARSAWAGAATRDFTDVDVAGLDAGLAAGSAGPAQRRAARRALRDDAAADRGGRPDGLPVLVGGRGRRGGADGLQPAGRRHPGRRAAADLPVTLFCDPRAAGWCAPFVVAHASGPDRRCSTTGCRWGGPTGSATAAGRAAPHPALGRDRRAAGHPRRRQPDLRRRQGASLEEMVAATERGLLLTCLWYIREVDPQTLLLTGLTRDGVYLVEDGEVAAR